jgi:hypothetical protein
MKQYKSKYAGIGRWNRCATMILEINRVRVILECTVFLMGDIYNGQNSFVHINMNRLVQRKDTF